MDMHYILKKNRVIVKNFESKQLCENELLNFLKNIEFILDDCSKTGKRLISMVFEKFWI